MILKLRCMKQYSYNCTITGEEWVHTQEIEAGKVSTIEIPEEAGRKLRFSFEYIEQENKNIKIVNNFIYPIANMIRGFGMKNLPFLTDYMDDISTTITLPEKASDDEKETVMEMTFQDTRVDGKGTPKVTMLFMDKIPEGTIVEHELDEERINREFEAWIGYKTIIYTSPIILVSLILVITLLMKLVKASIIVIVLLAAIVYAFINFRKVCKRLFAEFIEYWHGYSAKQLPEQTVE